VSDFRRYGALTFAQAHGASVKTISIRFEDDFSSFRTGLGRTCIHRKGGFKTLTLQRLERWFLRAKEEEKHLQHGIGVVKSKLETF
jgi:hypothetical protein